MKGGEKMTWEKVEHKIKGIDYLKFIKEKNRWRDKFMGK